MRISVEFQPVEALAAREHELDGCQRRRERQEAGPVQWPIYVGAVRRQEHAQAGHGHDADRHDRVEGVAPCVLLGHVAAESWADDRTDHHAEAEQAKHHGVLALGIGVEQDRLGKRGRGRAESALKDAPHHQFFQRVRQAAHQGGEGEARDRPDHHALQAEAAREPAGHRSDNGGREDVEGDDPGDLVRGGRHGALHLGEHGGDDENGGRIERGCHDHADEDHGALPRCQAAFCRFRLAHANSSSGRCCRLNLYLDGVASNARERCIERRAHASWQEAFVEAQGLTIALLAVACFYSIGPGHVGSGVLGGTRAQGGNKALAGG